MNINITRSLFIGSQYGIVSILLLLSLGFYLYQDMVEADFTARALEVFDVGRENSLPTWISSFNLLVSSVLLLFIYLEKRDDSQSWTRYWLILCLLFLVLSIDEVAGLHERSSGLRWIIGPLVPPDSPLAPFWDINRWVFYGAIFAGLALISFIPFLLMLPPRIARRFLLAGSVFVGGAVGMEFAGVWMIQADVAQIGDLIYNIRRIFEEGMEMYGIVIFNCALFDEITSGNRTLTIQIGSSR